MTLAALLAAVSLSAQSGKLQTCRFEADTVSVLKNPLNGWVVYLHRSWDEDFWSKTGYDSMQTSEGITVKVSDYATTAYMRTSWAMLEPEEGRYAWRDENSRVYRLVKSAMDRGLRMSFRIVVDGRDQGQNTPLYLYEKYNAPYFTFGNSRHKSPYPQDSVFRAHYEKLIEALAEDFNDPAKTDFIDGYGLGKWGEGHNVVYEPDNAITERTESLKEETMRWITGLYSRCFTKVPVVINYHRHIGHPVSEGREANPNSRKMLQIAIDNGYGLRSDAIGMNNQDWGYNDWDKAFASDFSYRLPTIMEGGWIVGQHSWWKDPAGYRTPKDVRKGEYETSKETKVNMMDLRAGKETKSWFNDAFDYVKKFTVEGGYRLYPDLIEYNKVLRKGDSLKITHRWNNIGWGYCPNNIRQWNYRYKVAFALLDKEGKVVETLVDGKAEPSEWLKGKPVTYNSTFSLEGVRSGKYILAAGIIDVSSENAIGIQLAVKPELKNAEGWVKLSEITLK